VEGRLKNIIDPKIQLTPADLSILDRIFELAFSCSAPTKVDRPNMSEAKENLWNIRKDYQFKLDRQNESLEAESLEHGDSFDGGYNRHGRPSPSPRGSRYSGDSESVKARTSRRSEDNSTRNHLS
jgi:hypothetical protein